MNRIVNTILLFVLALLPMSAENAASVLKKASDKLNASRGTTAVFSIQDINAGASKGSISIAGNKFALVTSYNTTIFNGKTQWTIDKSAKEVSIYNPTAEEVAQMNPLSLIKSATTSYKSSLIKSQAGTFKVQLLPKTKNSSLKKINITFSDKTYLPTIVDMYANDGNSLQIKISDVKLNVNIPAWTFSVSQKSYPGYDFVDLR